mmetsp:Transcript_8471/g.12264  ORF Transcript_8471/g.12264 Transcript_8471/m.12264 type:complete len:147 (-) Transcript_8471:153-593(-)
MRINRYYLLMIILVGLCFGEIAGENPKSTLNEGSCGSAESPEMVETLSEQLKEALQRVEEIEKERDELEASTTKRINNLRMKMVDAANQQKTMETTNRDCSYAYEQVVLRERKTQEENETKEKSYKAQIEKLTKELQEERSKPCTT